MSSSKVSVIVPFYNTENYISTCLEALTTQTCPDLEIICVNDGSTDRSRSIVENFQKDDARIHIIDLDRCGPGISRNHGLKKASGDYVMFCDSDDSCKPDMVSAMVRLITADKDIDLAMCSCTLHNTNKTRRKDKTYALNHRNGVFELTQSLKRAVNIVLWNKLFKRELLIKYNIQFIDTKYHEDENFVFKYLSVSRKINFTDAALYHYTFRNGSLSEGTVRQPVHVNEYLECLGNFSNFLDHHALWDRNSQFFAQALIYVFSLARHKDLDDKQRLVFLSGLYALVQKLDPQKINSTQIRQTVLTMCKDSLASCQSASMPDICRTEKSVPVFFACDDNYSRYLCVALQSIMENATQGYIYHIIILDCGMERDGIKILERQLADKTNFTLHIVSAAAFLKKHKAYFREKEHFTAAIYARFLVPDICRDFDKAIYADTDMIFGRDIAALMHLDLEDNYIAAVLDSGMEIERRSIAKQAKYFQETLLLNTQDGYVNSGLVVFNLKKWREFSLHDQCLRFLENAKEFIFPDQDAINMVCKGKIHYLDQSWNCTCSTKATLHYASSIKAINQSVFLEDLVIQYNRAYNGPDTVFHYTSSTKPWNTPNMEKAEKWWVCCKKTECYEPILFQSTVKLVQNNLASSKTDEMDNPFTWGGGMNNNTWKSLVKNYYLLGLPVLKTKFTAESKKFYVFGMRIAKIVKEQHKKKYYIFGLRVFTLKVWKR